MRTSNVKNLTFIILFLVLAAPVVLPQLDKTGHWDFAPSGWGFASVCNAADGNYIDCNVVDCNCCYAPSRCGDSIYRRMEFHGRNYIKAPYDVCTNFNIALNISETWLTSYNGCDLNGDGIVNFNDYAIMIKWWEENRRIYARP
ncbi:MAG: hypothetical protein MUP16_05715 [Sedimentisphaerales bacterium]|nr:hypothetical protein [Sedimentisphaerales bacterium]